MAIGDSRLWRTSHDSDDEEGIRLMSSDEQQEENARDVRPTGTSRTRQRLVRALWAVAALVAFVLAWRILRSLFTRPTRPACVIISHEFGNSNGFGSEYNIYVRPSLASTAYSLIPVSAAPSRCARASHGLGCRPGHAQLDLRPARLILRASTSARLHTAPRTRNRARQGWMAQRASTSNDAQ